MLYTLDGMEYASNRSSHEKLKSFLPFRLFLFISIPFAVSFWDLTSFCLSCCFAAFPCNQADVAAREHEEKSS